MYILVMFPLFVFRFLRHVLLGLAYRLHCGPVQGGILLILYMYLCFIRRPSGLSVRVENKTHAVYIAF